MKKNSFFENIFKKKVSRKAFIKMSSVCLGGLIAGATFPKISFGEEVSNGRKPRKVKTDHDLCVVKGEDPYAMTKKSVEGLGGMKRFVKQGDTVVIKPNMAWDRTVEQAANTNPYVVAALVDLCFQAGAKRVNIFERTCNDEKRCYKNSGIAELARKHKANVYFVDDWNYIKAHFPYESPMENWPIYRDAIKCDVFINVPILKHHAITGLTLSMKNLMGICGGVRGLMHIGIGKKLVHVTDFIKPELTIMDAYRVLAKNGPRGGSLADVEDHKTVIAGTDPLLVDSYSCKLVNKDPSTVNYIPEAIQHGLGNSDINKASIKEVKV